MDMYCECGAIVDGECACMLEAEGQKLSLSSWGNLNGLIRSLPSQAQSA